MQIFVLICNSIQLIALEIKKNAINQTKSNRKRHTKTELTINIIELN